MGLHLIKLSAGTRGVEELAAWQRSAAAKAPCGNPRHVTRMWPKRAAEILEGGSIFWVIKGAVLCRQPILKLEEVRREDGILRCGIVLRAGLVPVVPTPRKAFQGWRYLAAADAPGDLGETAPGEGHLPPRMAAALAEIGVF